MDWAWAIIAYMVIGLILSEGTVQYYRSKKLSVPKGEYLLALFLGPVVIFIASMMHLRRKLLK